MEQFRPKFAADGLIRAIAVDASTGVVLMDAFMNEEAYGETLRTRRAVYFSRSRQKLWRKGEESGYVQNVSEIRVNCNGDSLLLFVEQVGGAACHDGYKSCFYRRLGADGQLTIVEERVFDPKKAHQKRPREFFEPGHDEGDYLWGKDDENP